MLGAAGAGARRPVILAAEPSIFVADFARACAFYVDDLGFRLETTYGDPPFFGLLGRDGARLSLRLVEEPAFVVGLRERRELLAASLTLASRSDVDALFDEFRGRHVDVFQAPRTEPWGARTFILRDPDGNLLLFAAPAA
jgi:catechol 2,3-dioxygenase-like lactoylglutathione lyase family enzyme